MTDFLILLADDRGGARVTADQLALADLLTLVPAQVDERLERLSTFRVYGPTYRRAVNESCRDAELFTARGEMAAATHYLLHAERSAGLITWDDVEAQDPFRVAQ